MRPVLKHLTFFFPLIFNGSWYYCDIWSPSLCWQRVTWHHELLTILHFLGTQSCWFSYQSFLFCFLKWIAEATPKTIMRTMGVKGLTLYHLKSHLQVCWYHCLFILFDLQGISFLWFHAHSSSWHFYLQKYRLGKQSCKESTDNSKDGIGLVSLERFLQVIFFTLFN
jgi:hypothetical protein